MQSITENHTEVLEELFFFFSCYIPIYIFILTSYDLPQCWSNISREDYLFNMLFPTSKGTDQLKKVRELPILLPFWPITKPSYTQKLKRIEELGEKKKSSSAFAKTWMSCTYFHVITMLSLSEPEGLRLTVMSCGCGEKRSFVSHTLLPITTVLPKTRTSTAFISNWNKQLVWKPPCFKSA